MTSMDHVVLPDGRRLGLRISGPGDGLPLVFHHGTPGAAVPIRAYERAAHARGLRFLTTSRPGYGSSTRHRGRRVIDVVADTAAALEAVGAERCVVVGWCGGGPHALACAARLPSCLGALVVAGVAPFEADGLDWLAGMGEENQAEFAAALRGETELRGYLEGEAPGLRRAGTEDIIASLAGVLPEVDRAAITGEFGEDLAASFHEALRTGVDGWLDDDLAFLAPWGFELDEILVPTAVWQGGEDLMVPSAHGHWLASRLPGVQAHLEEGEGHLSIALGAVDAMLDELAAAAEG